jgi:hypothetical protein
MQDLVGPGSWRLLKLWQKPRLGRVAGVRRGVTKEARNPEAVEDWFSYLTNLKSSCVPVVRQLPRLYVSSPTSYAALRRREFSYLCGKSFVMHSEDLRMRSVGFLDDRYTSRPSRS